MSKRKIRNYDKEFKLNAVKLYLQGGRTYQQIGDELGIPAATLVGWVLAYQKENDKEQAFPGKGHLKPSDAEIAQLRRDLANAREERDILKKALGIFSSQRK
jgi:transposase-like protein